MATTTPVASWSAELAITASVSYTYTATPGAGGYLRMQYSLNGVWVDFANNPITAAVTARVPAGAVALRGQGYGAEGSFDATALPTADDLPASWSDSTSAVLVDPQGRNQTFVRQALTVESLDPKFLGPGIAADYNADVFTGIADGGNVTTWFDSSGNGNNLTTASGTPPILKSGVNGIGGKAAVRFIKASSTYLTGSLVDKIPTRYPVSCVAVLRCVTSSGTHKIAAVHAAGGSGGWHLTMSNGQPTTYAGQTFSSAQVFTNGKVSVVGFSLNSNLSHEHVINGNWGVAGTSNQDMNGTPTAITLGAYGSLAADFADFDIARLIIFRSELTYEQMRAIQVFLAEQCGFSRSQYFGNRYQSANPLTILTPLGDLNATHPDVIYGGGATIASTGYKYIMAFTPMPEAQENPCIAGSQDGTTWEKPSGVTNPLVAKPAGASDYNSDTDIHIGADGRLALVYREALTSNTTETIKVIYSSDARAWTAPATIMDASGISTGVSLRKLLSPAVVYDGTQYLMWTVREITAAPLLRSVDLRRASTLAGLSSATVESTNMFNAAKTTNQEIWHLDVIYKSGIYYALAYVASTLELYASIDGKSWTCARTNVAYTQGAGTFASSNLYRSTMQFDDNGDLTVWYPGFDGSTYRIAKMTLSKIHLPQVGGV